jgi:hypothetical protein
VKIWERVNVDFQFVTTNLFNHPVFYDPGFNINGLDPTSPSSFGVINQQGNNPRQFQFGIRLSF